jgi:serine/threonine-protein kinase ULK/ATG1
VNEIKTLSSIESSPHIVRYVDMLKTANNYYFVYEFCNGGTLSKCIQSYTHCSNGVMPLNTALLYFSQLLQAFKILAKHNIMHRDLKPDNVLLHNGILKVADFGFCKSM